MTPADFLTHFAPLTDTEGGVKKLRNLILQLAVQGKLIEQVPKDEPAANLLKSIETQRKHLLEQKRIRNVRLNKIGHGEIPFPIPSSWSWVRLGEMFLENHGRNP